MSAAARAASDGDSDAERREAKAKRVADRRGNAGRTRGDAPIKFRTTFRNVIYAVLKCRGWKETDAELDWDIHWADREWVYEVFDTVHLENWQRVNHYRNGRELCRKDNLIKNIKRMRRQLERDGNWEEAAQYDFCPSTYVLPGDYALFVEEHKKYPGDTWIMKPIGKAQGKGIFMFQKLSDIADWRSDYRWKPDHPSVESYVVQRYISNPYLVGGKKFDMRIYVLVTSYSPLVVWLYRTGFGRFTHAPFNLSDTSNMHVHLTNVAIQKTAENYNTDFGGKWDLRQIKLHVMSRHGVAKADKLFADIQAVIMRALLAVQNIMISDKHCFELYGYDMLFDDTLKPWLFELSANTREDYDLKFKMLNDVLDIIDIEQRLTGSEEHVGGFDLIWKDAPVKSEKASIWSTELGMDFARSLNTFKAPKKKGEKGSTGVRGRDDAVASGGGGGGSGGGGGGGGGGAGGGGGGTSAAEGRGTRGVAASSDRPRSGRRLI